MNLLFGEFSCLFFRTITLVRLKLQGPLHSLLFPLDLALGSQDQHKAELIAFLRRLTFEELKDLKSRFRPLSQQVFSRINRIDYKLNCLISDPENKKIYTDLLQSRIFLLKFLAVLPAQFTYKQFIDHQRLKRKPYFQLLTLSQQLQPNSDELDPHKLMVQLLRRNRPASNTLRGYLQNQKCKRIIRTSAVRRLNSAISQQKLKSFINKKIGSAANQKHNSIKILFRPNKVSINFTSALFNPGRQKLHRTKSEKEYRNSHVKLNTCLDQFQ